jgi:peptide deformylase
MTIPPEIAPAPVLLVGDPRLRQVAPPVADFDDPALHADVAVLTATLRHFRRAHGFGRAIAAPQIGVARRLIALDLGDGPFCVVNPEVTWRSESTFTMWDDCMSFPDLLVRLRRHDSLSLRYRDERGREITWERLERATSELLQHEIDHLDGVLFTDHAEGRDALVLRPVFEADPQHFRAQVDYVIGD